MAPPHLAGKRVSCPNCGSPITVPAPAPAPLEESILVTCLCGQQFRAQPHLAGKTVRCGYARAQFRSRLASTPERFLKTISLRPCQLMIH